MTVEIEREVVVEREPGLGDLVLGLWRNAAFILLVTFAFGVLGYVYALLLTPKYEAVAVIIFPKDAMTSLLSTFGVGLDGQQGGDKTNALPMLGVAPARQPTMDYAAAVLESRSSAEMVAKALDLPKAWGLEPMPLVIKRLQMNLSVQRQVRENKMVLSFRDPDRELTEKVLQSYLKTYDLYTQEHSLTAATRQRRFVESQLEKSEKELENSRRELVRFEAGNATDVVQSQPEASGRLYSTMLQQQMEATGELEEARSLVATLRQKKLEHASSLLSNSNGPPPKDDPLVAELQGQVLTAQANVDNLLLTRTEEHPEVVAAREQVGKLQGELERRLTSLQGAYSEDLSVDLMEATARQAAAEALKQAMDSQVEDFQTRISSLPGPAMSYTMLKRRFTLAESMNRALRMELQRALITESLDSVALEVLDPPHASEKPVFPKKGTMAIATAVLGFLLACGWVLVRRLRTEPLA